MTPNPARNPRTVRTSRRRARLIISALTAALTLSVAAVLAPVPLAPPAHAAPGSYKLWYMPDSSVARWNPCNGIRYKVNVGGLRDPEAAVRDVRTAVGRISQATGLHFFYHGTTRTVPRRNSVGDPNFPLVISWALPGSGSAGRSDILDGRASAFGGWRGAATRRLDGSYFYQISSGYIVLDRSKAHAVRPGFAANARGVLLMHELGHVVGLQHVSDRSQLMYPTMTNVTGFGDGDRNGLRRVGRPAGCLR